MIAKRPDPPGKTNPAAVFVCSSHYERNIDGTLAA
jgi:hypothetical protein